MFPPPKPELANAEIEQAVAHMQEVIELGRAARDRRKLPLKVNYTCHITIHHFFFFANLPASSSIVSFERSDCGQSQQEIAGQLGVPEKLYSCCT